MRDLGRHPQEIHELAVGEDPAEVLVDQDDAVAHVVEHELHRLARLLDVGGALLHLLEHGTAEQRALAREAIVQGGTEHFDAVFSAIHASAALEVTFEAAKREADAAEQAAMQFPPSQLKETLIDLCAFSLRRQS